jgi:uncharacterized protein YqjF (DUF2071 family)
LDKKVLDAGDIDMYTSNILKTTSDQVKGKTNMKFQKINRETKTGKVFTALQAGERLTPAEARKRFGVANLSAEASRIRQLGFAVYAKSRKAGNNVQVTEYVMGEPSREIVALGYKAKAMGITL